MIKNHGRPGSLAFLVHPGFNAWMPVNLTLSKLLDRSRYRQQFHSRHVGKAGLGLSIWAYTALDYRCPAEAGLSTQTAIPRRIQRGNTQAESMRV